VANGQRLVSIDFNNVDIVVFIKFISDLTKKNFVIDERVKAKVSIVSPGKITVDEAYKVFESVLDVHGFSAIPSGEITKIVPAPEARTKNIKTRLQEETGASDDSVVTQIIPMRYADTEEIKRLFTPLVSKNAVILSYSPTNTLIITDVQSNINRLLRILKAIDVTGVGQQIALIKVQYADATKLVTLLTSVFKPPQRAGKPTPEQKEITFVADERTNTLVVLASEGDTENIRQLVRNLDQEMPKGQGRIHVYYLEHATAEDLAKVLQDIPQQKSGGAPEGKPVTQGVSDKVKITADKATNSLIINADNQDYATIEEIIRKVDIPRAMVYIEALIMEVNVNKDFRLGTEWVLGGKTARNEKELIYGGGFSGGALGGDPGYSQVGTAVVGSGAAATSVKVLPPGMALGIFGEALEISGVKFPSIGAVIDAYKKDRDARILSTPQILTTDNQEAKIYVGRNVPFRTSATATQTANAVYNSFEYRDVGKTLKITPQISKDHQVRLALSLEVTELESIEDNKPTTLKRTMETTAIVRDKQTIVLGGLIDDLSSVTDYRVPCLGDIPGIGMLFRSMATGGTKTNLYIFLTPRVIPKPEDGTEISAKKREEIDQLRSQDIKLYNKNPEPPPTQTVPAPGGASNRQDSETLRTAPVSSISETPPKRSSGDHPVISESLTPTDNLEKAVTNPSPSPANTLTSATAEASVSSPARPDNTSAAAIAKPASAPSNGRTSGGYTIQVISLQTVEAADQMLKELTAKGYAAYTVRSENSGKTWYRMRIGYFDNAKAAEEVMAQLRASRYQPILIKL
jgi:general secretion pathway protein D